MEDSQCPDVADEMRDYLGPSIKVESNKMKLKIENSLVDNTYMDMKIETREDKSLKIGVSWNLVKDKTFTWITPLTDDKTTYLINVKKGSIPVKGFYKFKGK